MTHDDGVCGNEPEQQAPSAPEPIEDNRDAEHSALMQRMAMLEGEVERLRAGRNEDGDAVRSGSTFNPTLGGFVNWPLQGGITRDYVYVGKKRLAIPEQTSYVLKVYLDGQTPPEWVESMPDEMDDNAEYYDVRKNHIHLPGNFGG